MSPGTIVRTRSGYIVLALLYLQRCVISYDVVVTGFWRIVSFTTSGACSTDVVRVTAEIDVQVKAPCLVRPVKISLALKARPITVQSGALVPGVHLAPCLPTYPIRPRLPMKQRGMTTARGWRQRGR